MKRCIYRFHTMVEKFNSSKVTTLSKFSVLSFCNSPMSLKAPKTWFCLAQETIKADNQDGITKRRELTATERSLLFPTSSAFTKHYCCKMPAVLFRTQHRTLIFAHQCESYVLIIRVNCGT